jgi:uncharacterized protein (TIGR02449 family)
MDLFRSKNYIYAMNTSTQQNIDALERKTEELLRLVQRLSTENATLKAQLHSMKLDKSGLVEQKEQVRSQVEQMIARLKAMETAS